MRDKSKYYTDLSLRLLRFLPVNKSGRYQINVRLFLYPVKLLYVKAKSAFMPIAKYGSSRNALVQAI